MKFALIFLLTVSSAFAVESDKIFKLFTNDGKDEYCATAFFISETRLLTAAHTFEHKTTRHVIIHDGKTVELKLIKIDKHADIAILECAEKNPTFYVLSEFLPSKGELVSALGFCHQEKFLTDLQETVKKVGGMIECTPDGVNGMSGCPLVDASGQVVGMLVKGWGGVSKSVSSPRLKEFVGK